MSLLRRGLRSIARTARRVWCLVVDLSRLWHRAPELTIDPRRLNDELRRSALVGLDDDMIYRERVKQRIRDGARCACPPLIDRSRLRSFETLRRGGRMEWYGL